MSTPGHFHFTYSPDTIIRLTLRTLQLVFAVTTCGLYGADLAHWTKTNTHAEASWIYAEVIGAFSLITLLIYSIPAVRSRRAWPWDFVLFILWVALFGVFGNVYLGSQTDDGPPDTDSGGYDHARMKSAVWIDMINMLLWFATGLYEAIKWGGEKKNLRRARKLKEEASRGMPQEEGMLEGGHLAENGSEKDTVAPPPYEDELGSDVAYGAEMKKTPSEK